MLKPRESCDRTETEDHQPTEEVDARVISSELLSAVMSLMPDAAVVVDETGTIVSVNTQAEELFGYQTGALVGISVDSLVPERLRTRHREHRSTYLSLPQKRPMGVGLALTGRRRDGTEFPLDISLAPITDSGRSLFVAAVRDMTEQRSANAAQAELATIVNSALDAIVSMTVEGKITSWNPAAEKLFGYASDEICGKHVAILVPEQSSEVFESLLDAAYAGGGHGASDTEWRHRDGHDVDVAVSISPLRNQSGTVYGISSMVRDISERRKVEAELRRLLTETQRLEHQHAATAEIRLAQLSGAPLQDSLMLVCEWASDLIAAPVVVISLKDEAGTRILAATGLPQDMIGMPLPEGKSFSERVIEEARILEIERRTDMSEIDLPEYLPNGWTLGLPVVLRGQVSVSLTFVRTEGEPMFSNSDRTFAESLVGQIGLAFELERAKIDREEVMLVGDRERIARDLHDQVIQRLFATGMGLQSAIGLIDRPVAQEKVSSAIDLLDETVREIRNTIFSLSRSGATEHLLRSQVLDVTKESKTPLGFEPSLAFEGPVDTGVPEDIVPHLLAVIREALSNVARHAQAKSAHVRVAFIGDELVLEVIDDGVGIVHGTRSSGLSNLEERALLFGGKFSVAPHDGGGTCLLWRVPVVR